MKKLRWLPIALMVCSLGLTGCGKNKGGSGGNGGDQSGEQQKAEPKVSKVTIANPDDTTVLDGQRVSLKATVSGDEGVSQKVTWSSSDNAIATVTNGVVNFQKVSEQKKVTITATSSADSTKSDSVEFTVEHSPFDLKNSRGNPDTSLFLDEGKFIVEDPQDVALIYSDVHATRWYVDATITITDLDKTDAWPKFGIMASEREDGFWCHEQSKQVFFYADTPSAQTTWTGFNVVPENLEATDWNWAGQLCPGTASPAMKLGEAFKMGFMRDGDYFYCFYGKATDTNLGLVGVCEYNHFGDQANYVWLGGWKTAVDIADPHWLVGDEIDSMYIVPESLSLKKDEETLYFGNSTQIEVTTEGLWNRNKLQFASDDETLATVDSKGLVTVNDTNTGTAHITVGLAGTEVSKQFTINVTDDPLFNVILDGEMNDAIWSNTVKTNLYLLKRDNNNYIKFYAAKNSRGVYIFADYNVSAVKPGNPNEWWTYDNFEFYFADADLAWGGQYWVSAMNGGSFVSVGSGEKPEAVYYKNLTEGADHIFHGAFELFVPYGDDNNTEGEATYFRVGSNPNAGWYNSYNWNSGANVNTLQITANGFAHDGTSCSEGHAYGEWIIDTAATCSSAGHAHRVCSFCGVVEEKDLEIVPNAHHFDYDNAVVDTPATCIATGTGTATCTLCGATESTTLPKDYTNHVDADYPSTHTHCSSCGMGSYLTNASGDAYDHSGGDPWDQSKWYDVGLFSGDFTFVFELEMHGGIGGNPDDWGTYCWKSILPFVYDSGHNGHFFRMDWCGYGEPAAFGNYNHGSDVGGLYPSAYDLFANANVKITYTRVGANISIDWVIEGTAGAFDGVVINNYHQGCVMTDANAQLGIALSAEFTTATINRAELIRSN